MGKSRSRSRRRRTRAKWVPLVGLAVAAAVSLSLAALAINQTSQVAGAGTVRESGYTPPDRLVNPLVAIIGDSFTGGSEMGGVGPTNWSAIATEQLGLRNCAYAAGGSGWTTAVNQDVIFGQRVDWAVSMKPSLVVFFGGVNDLAAGANRVGTEANAALADVKAKLPGVPVVVIGPVVVRDEQRPVAEKVRNSLADAAAANGAAYIDPIAEGWFNGDARKYLGADRFHPTDEGHVYMADLIRKDLEALGYGGLPQKPATESVDCVIPKPGA